MDCFKCYMVYMIIAIIRIIYILQKAMIILYPIESDFLSRIILSGQMQISLKRRDALPLLE